jgi:hypothetical protein
MAKVAKKVAKKATPKAAAPGKAVSRKPPASTTDVTRSLQDRMREAAGRGTETMTQADLALPFIALLQQLSPQVQRGNDRYNPDAEAGDFYNTVTGELWSGEDGMRVIPCFYEKVYNVWTKRDEGGGFGGTFKDRLEAEEMHDPQTQDVMDTANHYLLVELEDRTWGEAVLSCTSTKLTPSRRWNTMMKQLKLGEGRERFTPPSYARTYRITAVTQKNDKGQYFVPLMTPDEWVEDEDLFEQAESFYAMFAAGETKVSYEHAQEVVEADVEVDDAADEVEY